MKTIINIGIALAAWGACIGCAYLIHVGGFASSETVELSALRIAVVALFVMHFNRREAPDETK